MYVVLECSSLSIVHLKKPPCGHPCISCGKNLIPSYQQKMYSNCFLFIIMRPNQFELLKLEKSPKYKSNLFFHGERFYVQVPQCIREIHHSKHPHTQYSCKLKECVIELNHFRVGFCLSVSLSHETSLNSLSLVEFSFRQLL